MGIPLLHGRYFSDQDQPASPSGAVVNETLARRFWPGEDPTGRRLRGFDARGQHDEWVAVVGVVRDTRSTGLKKNPISQIYDPQLRHSNRGRPGPIGHGRPGCSPVRLALFGRRTRSVLYYMVFGKQIRLRSGRSRSSCQVSPPLRAMFPLCAVPAWIRLLPFAPDQSPADCHPIANPQRINWNQCAPWRSYSSFPPS